MAERPRFTFSTGPGGRLLLLEGAWSSAYADDVERAADLLQKTSGTGPLIIDLSRLASFDTLGALLINRAIRDWQGSGRIISVQGTSEASRVLLDEIRLVPAPVIVASGENKAVGLVADIGESVVIAGRDFMGSTSFLGQVIAAFGKLILAPYRIRFTSIVAQIEHIAFRGVPIIMLISFLVGAIVAQQGIFQLNRFGASTFAVNLIGILVLRELGVLLTSIMVAGRSGSAFTAELGSMTMREEVDALRVMGLDPIEILVLPRVIALVVGLPLLTFISDLSALFGGGVVSWLYAGMSSDVYLERLKDAIALQTIFAGLIKAPFMALVIALVACGDGLSVRGSAESLGRQVTDAVVKSIFMVIVVDGIFAMFFAAIRF
jgi:phospholipid/cholesterol/gamma-HCH transport system permease protein